MGLMDKFDEMKNKGQDLAGEHGDKIDQAAEKVDEKTGGKYSDQIQEGSDRVQEWGQQGQEGQENQ